MPSHPAADHSRRYHCKHSDIHPQTMATGNVRRPAALISKRVLAALSDHSIADIDRSCIHFANEPSQ